MSKAYDPSARINTSVTKYYVNASGDRWFIPYNTPGSGVAGTTKANQVTSCSAVVGNTADGTVAGAAVVAS